MAKIKVLWSGSCKHYGFIDAHDWNEEHNHYLATVDGRLETGQYLNSQNRISEYTCSRYQLGPFFINFGHVTGYGDKPLWFGRLGFTAVDYEYSIVPNIFNLTAIAMRTRYRWVEETGKQDDAHAWTSVLKKKLTENK